MSRETERAALATHFQSVWLTASEGPIAWPNKPFVTPTNSRFAVFNIVERGSYRKSLGLNHFFKRHEGSLQVDIYVPADLGTKPSRETAGRLEGIYQDLVLALSDGQKLIFGTPSARALGANEQRAANLDDNWDRYVFEAPFYRDEFVQK